MAQTQQYTNPSTTILFPKEIRGKMGVTDEMFKTTLKLFQEVFDVTHCIMLRFDVESKELIYATSSEEIEVPDRLVQLSWLLCKQYHSRLVQGQLLASSQNQEIFPISLKKVTKSHEVHSVLAIPLQIHPFTNISRLVETRHGASLPVSSCLEVIYLYHCHHDYYWTEKDLVLIRHLIAQYKLNIAQAQQLAQIANRDRQQMLLEQIIQQLNVPYSPEDLIADILRRIGESFQIEQVLLLQDEANQLQIYQNWFVNQNIEDNGKEWLKALELQDFYESKQWCYWQAKATPINPVTDEFQDSLQYSQVSLPIYIKGNFFGALLLQTKDYTRRFTYEEINLLENITSQIAIPLNELQIQIAMEKKQQRINEFLSQMTHELRAPLTGVLGFARMLQEQIYGSLNPKQSQYINTIVASGEHLLSLVNDFLDLSKIEAEREELEIEKLAVEDICLASLAIVQAKAEEQKLELQLQIAPDVDFCWGDQQRLKQILVNLLSNAVKFTEIGSVSLQVERRNTNLAFSVIDTGIGIAIEEQHKLFQPFQQLNHPLCRKHKGTGLGLALSRRLAQLHGGDIVLVSTPGQGSCFTLEIPISMQPLESTPTS